MSKRALNRMRRRQNADAKLTDRKKDPPVEEEPLQHWTDVLEDIRERDAEADARIVRIPELEDASADSDPPDLGGSDDEEDIPDVEDCRLSARQLARRKHRQELEGCNLFGRHTRSDEGLPPFAEDDRQTVAEETSQDSIRRPVKSKPWFTPSEVIDMSKDIDKRLRQIRLQRKEEAAGKKPIGVAGVRELAESSRKAWN